MPKPTVRVVDRVQVFVPEFQTPPILGHTLEPLEVLISVVVDAKAGGRTIVKRERTTPAIRRVSFVLIIRNYSNSHRIYIGLISISCM